MPTDTRSNQTTSSSSAANTADNIDPELLAQLNNKKKMVTTNSKYKIKISFIN